MDSIPSSSCYELCVTPASSAFPPAYSVHDIPSPLFKIKIAKYSSTFVHTGIPKAEDFREHARYIKNLHSHSSNHKQEACELPASVHVRYSQDPCHLAEFLRTYQYYVNQMSPLTEEDLLFLLLRRFADSSDASVYAELRRSDDVQLYDSTIDEPIESRSLESSLGRDPGILQADLTFHYPRQEEGEHSEDVINGFDYRPIPRSPSESNTTCSVTVNFPSSVCNNLSDEDVNLRSDDPPEYSNSSEWTEIWPEHDWAELPPKLQPPSFRVHRCHHAGVERGGEDDAFELPMGFPEVMQHLDEAFSDVAHATFRIQNQSRQSPPMIEGAIQSFECDLFATIPSVYVIVQRDGAFLVYSCFENRKEWISAHYGHEECSGC